MKDTTLLAAVMDSPDAYQTIADHIESNDLSPQGKMWWSLICEWYETDKQAKAVDRDILRERGNRAFPAAHRRTLLEFFDDIPDSPSPANAAEELLGLRRQSLGIVLQSKLVAQAPAEEVKGAIEDYVEVLEASTLGEVREVRVVQDDADMLAVSDTSAKITLHPRELTAKTRGGAVPGDHIVVFGRPESGKTLVVVNMVAGFVRRGHKVLYIGNEEDLSKTRLRLLCALLGRAEEAVRGNWEPALKAARKRGFYLATFIEMYPGSIREIVEAVEEYEPEVLVVDQLRNLDAGGKETGITPRLETLGRGVRDVGRKYGLVTISVTQAGDRTERSGQEPPLWFQMGDVDSSRTGLPATADLMIGVGVNQEMEGRGLRAISLPKNKLGRNHEGFLVQADIETSRIT